MSSGIPRYTSIAPVAPATIERFREVLPDALIDVWSSQGYGTAIQGFLKIIPPDRYLARIGGILPPGTIPIAATAFADVIVWDTNMRLAVNFRFRHRMVAGVASNLARFFTFMDGEHALNGSLSWSPYEGAVQLLGRPSYDECFGYVPLLALGGAEDPRHLEKTDLLSQVELIHDVAGPVPY